MPDKTGTHRTCWDVMGPDDISDDRDAVDRLLDRRIVMATGTLDDALVDRVASRLLALDLADPDPIQLVLDCPDADIDAAFGLFDVTESLTSQLTVVVGGRLIGAGLALLTGSARRLGRPNATVQFAEPHFTHTTGTADHVHRLVEEQRRRTGILIARIAERTSRPAVLVADDMTRGTFMSSADAVAYGLLDDVLRPAR